MGWDTEALGVPSRLCWQRSVCGHYVALLWRCDTRLQLPKWPTVLLLRLELSTPVGRDRGHSCRIGECRDELCDGLKHSIFVQGLCWLTPVCIEAKVRVRFLPHHGLRFEQANRSPSFSLWQSQN